MHNYLYTEDYYYSYFEDEETEAYKNKWLHGYTLVSGDSSQAQVSLILEYWSLTTQLPHQRHIFYGSSLIQNVLNGCKRAVVEFCLNLL